MIRIRVSVPSFHFPSLAGIRIEVVSITAVSCLTRFHLRDPRSFSLTSTDFPLSALGRLCARRRLFGRELRVAITE